MIELRLSGRILLLLLAAMLFLLPAWAEDGNLLVNGSFEQLDGDGLPSGWYTSAWIYDPASSSFSMAEGRSGQAVLVDNLQGNDARFAQNVRVSPDTLYRLSGWIRADDMRDTGRGANLSFEGVYVFSESVFDSDGEWVFVQAYGRTGPEQQELTVFARVGGYGGLSIGAAAFDDLRLEEVDSVPAGYRIEPLYAAPVEVQAAGTEEVSELAAAFWPWLLVLTGVYAAMAFVCSRWIAANPDDLRLRGEERSDRWLLPIVLAVAALLRILIAGNVTGYQVDVNCFISWGMTFADHGPWGFYQAVSFCDYPPGYLWIMGLNEGANRLLGGAVDVAFLHKIIPMTCDLLAAVLVWRIAREERVTRRQATLAAALVAFNPAIILNSAAWCQVDSVLCLLLMAVAYLAIRGKWAAVLPVYVVSILMKPQALMMGFLGLAAIILVLLRHRPQFRIRKGRRYIAFTPVWKQMGWGLVWSLVAALAIILPSAIGMGGLSWLFELYGNTLASYPYATVNTASLFYLAGGNWQSILYPAATGVTLVFLLLTGAWCVVTFLRRKDRAVTLLEPAIAIVLVIAVALTALGVTGLLSGDETAYILSTGNPWSVTQTPEGYEREYVPGVEGTWALRIHPAALLICGVLLLAAAGILVYLLRCRLRDGFQDRVHLGLLEPALMLLFTLVFACMLVFDTTWGALGTVTMALAFALVLPMFIRSGDMRMLPLCGAVLFTLLYVFGVKMHERYLFPALFLLGMAAVLRRDKRLIWLMAGLSATVFINAGIVLDNSIRLGSAMGHLNADTHALACVLAAVNVALALWAVWLCQRICAEGAPLKAAGNAPGALGPAEVLAEPCSPLTYRDDHRVRWGRLDAILIAVVTAVYSIVTFTTLGATTAPQTACSLNDEQSAVVIDLGAHYADFTFLYNCQVSYRDFTVETSDDGVTWTEDRSWWAEMAEGQCFRWKYLTPYYLNGTQRAYYGAADLTGVVHLSGRYVRITAQRQHQHDANYYPIEMQAQTPLVFNEVLFRNAAGEAIAARVVGVSTPETTVPPAYSMRWRVLDALEMQLDAQDAALAGKSLLPLAAEACVSAVRSGMPVTPLAAPQPAAMKQPGAARYLPLTIPAYAPDFSALLDEPDTLEGEPGWWNSTYFDEIYHARTGFEHANGLDAYEWTHPPLGKVIMSWFIALFGMTPFGWRFAGALCGVLMLPAIYALAKQLTKKSWMAFAAMLLLAVDCMHFTQTRIATIDSYPVLFILLSYFFMLRFLQRDIVATPVRKLLPDLALSGFFMGCGMASKWIGVYAGLGLAVMYFWACFRALRISTDAARMQKSDGNFAPAARELLEKRARPAMKRVICLCLWCLLFFVAVPVAIYLATYIVHYQARDVGGVIEWLQLVWQTQINMLNYHGTPGMGMDHPYHSPWYEWFTMQRPMYYASPSFTPDGWRYAIYCFGNPVVWYLGLVGMAYAAYRWLMNHRYQLRADGPVWHLESKTWDVAPAFVLIGFAAQILPWVLVPRGTYIYHYFASVPFIILGAVLLLDRLCTRWKQRGEVVTVVLLALAVTAFVFLFPYASGVLSPSWWMDIIRNYPFVGGTLGDLLEAIPLMPNVW